MYEALLLPARVGDAIAARDPEDARRWATESIRLARALPDSPVVGFNLMMVAQVAALCGDAGEAALLHGAVREATPALTRSMAPRQVDAYDAMLATARAALGSEEFDAQAHRGAQLSWSAALDHATAYLHDTTAGDDVIDLRVANAPPATETALTGRQREVLQLLVAGLGNKEIAKRLRVSPKTVMHHTTAIYRALGVRGRAEAAVVAVRSGLA